MKWLDTDVSSVKATLQQTPEVLHCVGVDIPVHVPDRVIDDSVLVVSLQTIVRLQFISEDLPRPLRHAHEC